ncbi:MAG: hypothetical protein ISR34_09360 [Pirellulales bacterium]|nr:hypothetical protein [Pirellulales bacterium]
MFYLKNYSCFQPENETLRRRICDQTRLTGNKVFYDDTKPQAQRHAVFNLAADLIKDLRKPERFSHAYAWVQLGKVLALLDNQTATERAKQRIALDLLENARPLQSF